MNKRVFFSAIFIVMSLGICLFIANEYLKRVEIKAINSYLSTLKNEFYTKQIALDFSQTQCAGFIKHTCKISSIELDSNNAHFLQNHQITLKNTSISIIDLNRKKITLNLNIDAIMHNLLFLPRNFTYFISLQKQDSKLGYVMLDRVLHLDIGNVAVSVYFSVLMRDKRFRDKNIAFLLKEWLDTDTPSFYEYSLEKLDISLNAKDRVKTAFYKANSENLQGLIDNLNITSPHFEALKNATLRLMQNEISSIDFSVKRKNADLVFFNTLNESATTKKALEIKEIVDSIDENYEISILES